MRFSIGVDVGGTTSTICVGNDAREVLYVSSQFATNAGDGPQALIATLVSEIIAAVKQLGGDAPDIRGVGLATPGPATVDGVLLKAPNLKAELWNRFPIRAELEKAFQERHPEIQVKYIGDGQAAALGEYSMRSGGLTWDKIPETPHENITSLFMAIVGTGLGGGAVVGGAAVRGNEGRAGHVGHILLPEYAFRYPHDRQLLVGNAYCTAESAISLTSLTHQLGYRLTLDEWKEHPLNAVEGTPKDKAKQLRRLAAEGDALALQLFEDQAKALGIAMLNVNYLGDYDSLVIGGGIADLAPHVRQAYQETAEASYCEHALDGFKNLEGLELPVCGDDAPVIGALGWVLSELP